MSTSFTSTSKERLKKNEFEEGLTEVLNLNGFAEKSLGKLLALGIRHAEIDPPPLLLLNREARRMDCVRQSRIVLS